MFRRAVYALACVLALSLPAAAQEQTGQIQGTVKDTSGAVLPGVTVEAMNLATGAVAATRRHRRQRASTVSSACVLANTKSAPSFRASRPRKSSTIDLRLGQVLTVELALAVGGVAETVSVTAESPLIDTKQNVRQSNIRDEQIELLPHGRDFTSLVTQAPGANAEAKLGGLSIDGASAGENRYIIDGVETTDLQDGTSGKKLNVDLVEEVQVKSSGYTAEYGGAMGGVINTVTKSGSNDFHGTAGLQFQGNQTSVVCRCSRQRDQRSARRLDGRAEPVASLTDDNVRVHHLSRRRLHPLRTEHLARRSRSRGTSCGSSAATTQR